MQRSPATSEVEPSRSDLILTIGPAVEDSSVVAAFSHHDHEILRSMEASHIRTFHPRRGRMSPTAKEALLRVWPAIGIEVAGPPLDFGNVFGPDTPVVLELGSGMGEATVEHAQAQPDVGIIAIDVHTPGIASLARECESRSITNVRVAIGDGIELLRDRIAPGSVAGVRAYFPDPWPKARHQKRRLIRPNLVALIASRLSHGGFLHVATDAADYAEQMLDVLDAEPSLRNEFDTFAPRPTDRPITRYEQLGIAKGHEIYDLRYFRIESRT